MAPSISKTRNEPGSKIAEPTAQLIEAETVPVTHESISNLLQ